MRALRCLPVLLCVATTSLGAQQPEPTVSPQDTVHPESARVVTPPTPDQQRFLDGLRTATRGIAQLKDGVNRVTRAQGTSDSAAVRRAGRFLAGWCGSAHAFMRRGRPDLKVTVYSDTARLKARRLVTQIDSLIAYSATCEQDARRDPVPTAADLTKRLKAYEAALRDFRITLGLPVHDDSAKGSRH